MLPHFFFTQILAAAPMVGEEKSAKLALGEVFRGSPFIYTILGSLSLIAFVLWLYSLLTLKMSQMMPEPFLQQLRGHLINKEFDKALMACEKSPHFAASILASGIASRKHGHHVMMEAMQAEGKRSGVTLWQRISLINDIAIIAPMLGLLGTVLGLFYAFYDANRSADTLAAIFDGLGVAVGTTVVGLVVAILAMVFYATLKLRIVRLLTSIENEAVSMGHLIDVKTETPSS